MGLENKGQEGQSLWLDAKEELLQGIITLSEYTAYAIKNDFKKFAINTARYKFVSKILNNKETLLEIGCNDGFLTQAFNESKLNIVGLDFDEKAIEYANSNFKSEKMRFIYSDFFEVEITDTFDSVVAMDMIEHISPALEITFFEKVCQCLNQDGIAVIGTPNIEASKHQSELAARTHVNLYSHDRLLKVMKNFFKNVFLFSANDEVVHTGFYPMAHYFIAVGVSPRQ